MTYDCIFINSTPLFECKVRGLGAHRLAHELRLHDYSVLVVDFIDYFTWPQFETVLDKSLGDNTKFVAFSSTWFNTSSDKMLDGQGAHINEKYELLESSKTQLHKFLGRGLFPEMCKSVKERNKNVKILLGGSKAGILETCFRDCVDHAMFGYSESMIIDYVKNPDRFNYIIDHDTKAFNKQHGFDFKYSSTSFADNTFMSPWEVVPLELSRGCRFKCKFCAYPLIGMKDVANYYKDQDTLRNELIENYERFGIQKYAVVDDTFNDSTEKVKHFHEVFTNLPFKFHFWCYLRADVLAMNPEQMTLLHEMGLDGTWFGVETYTHKTGKAIGKGLDPNKIKEGLYKAKEMWKEDVYIQQGVIVGLPYETQADIEKNTIDFMMRKDCPVDMFGFNGLEIAGNDTMTNKYKFVYRSEFDERAADYGYYFPHADHRWRKDDDTDINSWEEARELANYWNDLGMQKYAPKVLDIHVSALDLDSYKDYDTLKTYTREKRGSLVDNAPPRSYLFNKDITKNYIEPLLNAL